MTVKEKADIIEQGIVIALPLAEHCKTWSQFSAWKNLSDKDFMKEYGDEVLAQYTMPTPDEISRAKRDAKRADKGKQRADGN